MNAENTGEAQQTEQGGGLSAVGKRLAAARQEQERELASVASDLHLNLEVVTALEAGEESSLPAMTFVRGYIKSYARLLGLDERQLLSQLPTTEDYRPAPLRTVGMRRRQLNLPLGRWLLWLFILAALVMLVVYGIPLVERLVNRVEQPPIEQGALPLPLDDERQAVEAGLLPAVPETPEQSSMQEPIEPEGKPVEPAMESVESAVEPVAEVEQPAAPVAAPPALSDEPDAEPEAPQLTGPAVITLRFSQDSWVEMESHGQKLVVGTQPAGSERTVRAEPPVQILLGNAPGVVLEYRGRIVNLEPYQRGKVARLVLED